VRDILIDAYENARFLSEQHFCVSPALNIECFNSENPDEEIHAPLVPLHLYYIVFELLKVLPEGKFSKKGTKRKYCLFSEFNARNN
jgi:hypothetical protein